MDTYQGVALGVECAWPTAHNSLEDKTRLTELPRAVASSGDTPVLPAVNQEGSHR
jgi:hypothetical protein